jgi:hypothetical protein
MFLVEPIISDITSVFRFHIRCISVVKSFVFENILGFFLDHISVS